MVTGARRGIGAETSLKAAGAGWDVWVNYQENAARAESVVANIVALGRRATAVQADISVEAEVVRLFETCDVELGRPVDPDETRRSARRGRQRHRLAAVR
jgi:NAD(P)-dependent dehydrogenase (short-subunit alcohol dehydrogenase family)